jgi:hypothetical protein
MALSAILPSRRHLLPRGARHSRGRLAGEIALGAAALAASGFAAYFIKERSQEEAKYRTLEQDGAFSLRRYDPRLIAQVRRAGTLTEAMDQGYRPLADYISGKEGSRQPGASDKGIAMAVPVSVFPADQSGLWDVRFTLPAAWIRATLPKPANGVTIADLPERTVAVLRFTGRGTDRALVAKKHAELLERVGKRGLLPTSEAEFAAYNAPIVPGSLRRNEWWVDVTGV